MKIGILTQYYPPEIGAPQARLSEAAASFAKRGHQVFVLTAMPNYPVGHVYPGYEGVFRKERRDGITIYRSYIYPANSLKRVRRLANYFSFVLSSLIVGAIALPRVDYLITESPPLFLGISGFLLSRLKRARWIFNVSDLWPESAVRLGLLSPDGFAFRLCAWLEAFCYRRAWLVAGQSKSILVSINERFPQCRTFHLSNGVDSRRFDPGLQSESARNLLASNGDCVVLYAGLHGIAQGLDQVLRAAEALRTEGGFRFVLVGDGPEKKELLEQASQRGLRNVQFMEPRPAKDVPALLAAADVILVPLKSYIPGAVPSKLYEAMASERPVVLVASGEAAEIVSEHRVGITVKPGDVQGLADALRTLRAAPQLRQTLAANGRNAAVQYFDRKKIMDGFIEYLGANFHS